VNYKAGVFLTGATGFVGNALLVRLIADEYRVVAAVRDSQALVSAGVRRVFISNFAAERNWLALLDSCDTVIHAAARVHVATGKEAEALALYRHVNVEGTLNLACHAAAAGVKRFVFISSIKVNGEATVNGKAFGADDKPAPEDAYGLSKLEAEQGLIQLGAETGIEVVIIRPPLVYGPGVKGNFASMIKLVEKGLPLPLGAIHNKRSLVGIDNLVDLIIRCIDHPAAANQAFLAGDGEDVSTTELLRGVGKAMGKPARLISVPAGLLQFGATLLGKKAMAQRLLGSLQVDISKTCELLDWKPPYTVEEGLRRCFERSN